MKRYFYILIAIISMMTFFPSSVDAQLTNYAQQARQKAQQRKAQETSRYNDIIDDWDISEYESYIRDYPKSQHVAEIKERMAEINLWKNAKDTNTVAAYRNYLSKTKYNRYEGYANQHIENLMADEIKAAWNKAVNTNTISGYQDFIRQYPNCSYVENANSRIKNLQAAQEWAQIKDSNDVSRLSKYVSDYAGTDNAKTAQQRLYMLRGMNAYKAGNMSSAYAEFKNLSASSFSDTAYRKAYADVMEYNDYRGLSSSSDLARLQNFVSKYPSGRYTSEVKNYIALKKAREFNQYSSSYSYNDALSYASGSTKATVQNLISNNEKEKKAIKSAERRAERRANGGLLRLGIEYLDVAMGFGDDLQFRYDFGLKLQVGNFADRVQAGVGIKFGFLGYDLDEGSEEDEPSIGWDVPLELYAKLNLFAYGSEKDKWMYLMGKMRYNFVRNESNWEWRYAQQPWAWGVAMGWAAKNWDINLYYERDIPHRNEWGYSNANSYIGLSFNYFFRLF